MFLISRDSTPHMPFSISRLPRLLRFYKTKFSPSSRCQKFQPIPKKKKKKKKSFQKKYKPTTNKNSPCHNSHTQQKYFHNQNQHHKIFHTQQKKKKIHNQNHMSKKVFQAQNHNQKIFHDQNHHQKISMIKITTKIFHDPTLILP